MSLCIYVSVCIGLLDTRINNQQKLKTVQFRSESDNVRAYDKNRVLKPRTELCKQIIRIKDCVRECGFVCVYVCVPLTIDYWTQGLITHKNRKQYSTVQIRIRECSSLGQNWSMEAKDRNVQTNNQNSRLCTSVWLCVCLCLCAFNNRLLDQE